MVTVKYISYFNDYLLISQADQIGYILIWSDKYIRFGSIPDDMLLFPPLGSIPAAIDYVYDSFFFNYSDADYLAQCAIVCPTNAVGAIVCPTNAVVDDINDAVYK